MIALLRHSEPIILIIKGVMYANSYHTVSYVHTEIIFPTYVIYSVII